MSKIQLKSPFLYEEPRRYQIEWKKTINDANTEVTEILELFDKDCKTITLKCFSEQLQTQMKQ